MENEDRDYMLSQSFPNKSINQDGSITDLFGNEVTNPDLGWLNKPGLPNKWLNPDGTYSTLAELVAEAVDVNIFVVVDELPPTGDPVKIYIVPNGNGGFDEYRWTGTTWDNIGMIEFDINNYYTKTQTDNDFLKKNNTTSYTPTNDYNPATKKYVDDNAVSFKPFQNTFNTTGTTAQFLNSITAQNLPAGMVYLGQVSLSDMPSGVTVQAEVEVYIYPQNVAYCVLRSAEVSPYTWEVNSYENRGWEPVGKAYADSLASNYDASGAASTAETNAKNYADGLASNYDASGSASTAETNAKNYADTKKTEAISSANSYTDTAIQTSITSVLGGSY